MKYDPGLATRVADALEQIGEPAIRQKNVFGGRGFMSASTPSSSSARRDHRQAHPGRLSAGVEEPGVTPFAPGGERPMGTWVVVDAEVIADDPELTTGCAAR